MKKDVTPGPYLVGRQVKKYGCGLIEIKSHYQEGVINYNLFGAIAYAVGTDKEAIATATLLAAAPELLESVEWFVRQFWGDYTEEYRISFRAEYPDHEIIKAEAAIKKSQV